MATITVRGLDEGVRRALGRRARRNGRSMEAEVRQILGDAVRVDLDVPNVLVEFHGACREDGLELPSPVRTHDAPRELFT